MKRIKIGMFLDSWYPNVDGVVIVVNNLLNNISEYADVTLVIPKMEKNIDDSIYPFKVIRIDSVKVPTTDYRLSLSDIKNKEILNRFNNIDFDIIHIHSPFTLGRLGIQIAKSKNIPVIATMHTRWDFEFKKYLKSDLLVKAIIKHLIKSYNNCYSCIAMNKQVIKVYQDYGFNGKYEIINNGTDFEMIKDKNKTINKINTMYNLKNTDILFLYVGRIISIKNIFFILDVLKILKERNFKFKMIFVGEGPDSEKLNIKRREYNLESDVLLLGKITDRELIKSLYYRADLFLFPSLFDTSSLVQKEAASQETPSLLIEGSVTADEVENNINGFTVNENREDYANRIEEILNNKELYNKVKKNARNDLAKPWKEIAKQTYNYYHKIIKEYNRKKD